MTEDFLHFIWRTHNFDFRDLRTTDGQHIEILDFGRWNTGSGPDFSMARVHLDGIEWVGNIEMHLLSSDWTRHNHAEDPAYENVILHVVLEEDTPAFTATRKLPCIELRNRIDGRLLGKYLRLMATTEWVPCAPHLSAVPELTKTAWLDRMLAERIASKTEAITTALAATHHHWEEVFYRTLAVAYGFKINGVPFERIARIVPLTIIYKHQDAPDQIAALYFGAAGLLNTIFTDVYPLSLQKEFHHLSAKHDITPIGRHVWKWGGLRPANFPTLRIAQFAAFMSNYQGFFRRMLESPDIDELAAAFAAPVHAYWDTHSDFDKPSRKLSRTMGRGSVDGLIINTIVPFLFCYGSYHQNQEYIDRALDLVCRIAPEHNAVTGGWTRLGMPHAHAGQSQALLHLKRDYCDRRRCVSCGIGNHLLNSMTAV